LKIGHSRIRLDAVCPAVVARTRWIAFSTAGGFPVSGTPRAADLAPTPVYVLDANGRIAYVVNGGAETIAAALRTV
jgi:hypothetical protein